jgi:exopolyphosphatase/guanosine-5'-triphosphate,3'-diphosphate pyrophosphatase
VITAVISIGDDTTDIDVTGAGPDGEAPASGHHVVPRGMRSLHRSHVTADPPLPQDLTNAIGDMLDHIDDALREVPHLARPDQVVMTGRIASVMAQVEIGADVAPAGFVLSRDAAEDVFRTLATEPTAQRRLNPGLPGELSDVVVAGCCAVVAVMRGLHLDSVVVGDAEAGG